MARGTKSHYSSVSMQELLDDLGIKKSVFDERFKKFCEIYQFDKEYNVFKKDPENNRTEFEFDWEWYPLFLALMRTIPSHPYYRDNAKDEYITLDRINSFLNNLVSEVESMPNHLRIEIMTHQSYQNALKEMLASKHLSQKLSEAITAIELLSPGERSDVMIELYKKLDEWIYTFFQNNYSLLTAQFANRQYVENQIEAIRHSAGDDFTNHLRSIEAYKMEHSTYSQLDRFMSFLLKRYVFQGKSLKPTTKLSPKQKEQRHNQAKKYAESKNRLYSNIEQLLPFNESLDSAPVQLFRQTLEIVLEEMTNTNDTVIEPYQKIIDNIKSAPYVKSDMENRILEAKRHAEALNEKDKRELKQLRLDKRREFLEQTIQACQEEINRMEVEDYHLPEENPLLKEIQANYLKFCDLIRTRTYLPASESFIGQLLSPSYNRPHKN